MSYTIIRKQDKTGLVLLESSVQVADDGFVTVPARFLAPQNSVPPNFILDSPWPIDVFPRGLPPIQEGLFLSSINIKKQNGLTYIDAVYVSALNPVRLSVAESDGKASFSGYVPEFVYATGGSLAEGSLSFDYTAVSVTHRYAVIGNNSLNTIPQGRITAIYNVVRRGASVRVGVRRIDLVQKNTETIGKVSRISVTASPYLEMPDTLPGAAAFIGGWQL